MIKIKYGKSHSDATNDYEVLLGRPMTVREFINEWMERNPLEWGYFGIKTVEPGNVFGKPYCEYSKGKLKSDLPTAYLDAMIKNVTGGGGWTRSDFLFEVDLPEIITPPKEKKMLLIKMYDMCEDCPCADLHLTATTIFAGGEQTRIQWDVKCNHEDACRRMEHKHEKEK